MAQIHINLAFNPDHTVTVRVHNRIVAQVDVRYKTPNEVFETIRWELITSNISLEDITLIEMMWQERR